MNAPTDEQLLREYLDGNTGSFELLVRRHAVELYQFVQRFTGIGGAAEDVVQETFLQLHSSARLFDTGRRFKPWLFTIAANKARDHLRRRTRRREVPLDANPGGDAESRQRFLDLLAAEPDQPERQMLWQEKQRLVRRIVAEMPEKLCEVLVLAYFHRLAYRDIGEIVGIPLGTVKSRLHAAVTWFGERYAEAVETQTEETNP